MCFYCSLQAIVSSSPDAAAAEQSAKLKKLEDAEKEVVSCWGLVLVLMCVSAGPQAEGV